MAFPVNEKYIQAAENELALRFPESYRKSMMNLNGGIAIPPHGEAFHGWELFPFYDTSDKKHIKRTCNHIVAETKTAWNDYGLPQHLIAIGSDGSGGYLVYCMDDNRHVDNAVYMTRGDYSNIEKVADDFSNMRHER